MTCIKKSVTITTRGRWQKLYENVARFMWPNNANSANFGELYEHVTLAVFCLYCHFAMHRVGMKIS